MAARWKPIFLGSLGGGLEFYDFAIYAVFASVLGQVFFQTEDASARLLSTFAVFAVGYLARPIGGLLFSHYGDRFGRRFMLRVTIGGMAASTIGMALMPGYAQLGVFAPALLVVLRVVQGVCLGGEIPGAMALLTENMPRNRALVCGCLFFMVDFGLLLAHATEWLIVSLMSEADVLSYGWRLAFLLGGVVAVIGFLLRQHLAESQSFEAIRDVTHKVPFVALIRRHAAELMYAFAVSCMIACIITVLFIYMNDYLTTVAQFPHGPVALGTLASVRSFIDLLPVVGWVSDRIGLKVSSVVGTLALAAVCVPVFTWLIAAPSHIMIGVVLLGGVAAVAFGAATPVIAAVFPTDVRYSGVALAYNLGFAIVGGLTPLFATWLIQTYQLVMAPAYILMFFVGAACLAMIAIPRRTLCSRPNQDGFPPRSEQ
ncbi:MAG: MFS transporter [Pseudomonadota bacterium]